MATKKSSSLKSLAGAPAPTRQTDIESAVSTPLRAPAAEAATPAAAKPEKSLKQQVLDILESSLRIEVEDGDFTSPNDRIIKVMLGRKCVTQARFNVNSRREYEG